MSPSVPALYHTAGARHVTCRTPRRSGAPAAGHEEGAPWQAPLFRIPEQPFGYPWLSAGGSIFSST